MSQQGRLEDQESALDTLTGNTGGPVSPDGLGNINILGAAPYTVTGNPGTFTLTITDDGTVAYTYTADTGSATPAANNLNILGDATQGSVTSGAGSTITITNSDATTSQKGVLETSTDAESIAGVATDIAVVPSSLAAKLGAQTVDGIAYGTGTSAAVGWTAGLTDGQIAIGSTAGVPAAANITSTGGTVTITNGANSINLETDGQVAIQFDTDSGTAVPAAGIVDVLGGTLMNTAGATNVVTINADDNVVGSVATDSGTVTPTVNSFTLAGGNGASTSGSGATATIDVSGGGLTWNVETGTSATMAVDNGYIGNNAAGVDFSLPATASVGSIFRVTGLQASWTISQNAGQTIYFGTSATTTGAGGSLVSTDDRDAIELVCVVADTDFQVLSSIGNITVN